MPKYTWTLISILYLAVCVSFADALFPWSAVALALWLAIASAVILRRPKESLDIE